MTDRRSLWALLGLSLLAVPLLWSLIGYAAESSRIPADADYAEASALIRAEHQPGDAVAVAPSWALRGLEQLGDLEPTFDPRLAERPPAAARLWVVAEPEGGETLSALAKRHQVEVDARAGRLRVVRFQVGAGRSYRAVDHLAEAKVSIVGPKQPVPCDAWKDDRWDCQGRPDWQHVGAEWLDADLAPRRVIWAHPPPAGERILLSFPDVTFGARLELSAGHTIHGAQFANAPVRVVVRASGVVVGELERGPAYPMETRVFDTAAVAGKRGALELEISTPDNGASHFAVDAEVFP